ncbi:MAG: proline dehydrogenase family protein, partial [Candidatus Dormibacteraceae bacterium]
MSIFDQAIANSVGLLPHRLVARIARRYIAGEELEAALPVIQRVNSEGCSATLNVLGEEVATTAMAERMRGLHCAALEAIAGRQLSSGISVKLTNLGLAIDQELAQANLYRVLETAARVERFVRIDMEESRYTDVTLQLTQQTHRAGYQVGTVIQARLHRSELDVAEMIKADIPVRLVKGIYLEP